jgi:hypothetical protein
MDQDATERLAAAHLAAALLTYQNPKIIGRAWRNALRTATPLSRADRPIAAAHDQARYQRG